MADENITPAITSTTINNSWGRANRISDQSIQWLYSRINDVSSSTSPIRYTVAGGPNTLAVPEATAGLEMPDLPDFGLDPSTMEKSLARINALDFSGLIDKLTNGFVEFIKTYYPLGNEMAAAVAWIERALTTGGAGINPSVEEAIWNRDRDRIMRDARRREDEIRTSYAAKGFPLPPGAMEYHLHLVQQDAYAEIANSSRTQAEKSFDAEVENARHALSSAITLRASAMEAAKNYITAMALGPQLAMQLAVAPLDAQAKVFSATSEFYKAQMSVYEVPMKLGMAKDEIELRVAEMNQRERTLFVELVDKAGSKGYELDYQAEMKKLELKVNAAISAAQNLGTQAAALYNGFKASVGVMGQEII